jgi:PAS domain S-box-containing protein
MTDRTELLEAALDSSFPDGIALLDKEGQIVFWNPAAEAITGYAGMDVMSRQVPEPLEPLLLDRTKPAGSEPWRRKSRNRVTDHGSPGSTSWATDGSRDGATMVLRDDMGRAHRHGGVFHPAESLDALPHGECGEGTSVEAAQTELKTGWKRSSMTFSRAARASAYCGSPSIRPTRCARRTAPVPATRCSKRWSGCWPTGCGPPRRWGAGATMSSGSFARAHAGDAGGPRAGAGQPGPDGGLSLVGRPGSITVSIGAAQAERNESLADLLERAKAAMFSSFHAGGNQITSAPGGQECSPL